MKNLEKNHLDFTGWRGPDLQNFPQHVKRIWAKTSGKNENSAFQNGHEMRKPKKEPNFSSHTGKRALCWRITSWMHIRSCQQSLSSINRILVRMITSVDYLNKVMVGKEERKIEEKRFCCEHLYHHHPSDAVIQKLGQRHPSPSMLLSKLFECLLKPSQ